jgi:hypothetical protein
MPSLESLATRIRGEYREMPGLRLTVPQACRLWQIDARTCETLLDQLVRDAFLAKTDHGAYIAVPAVDGRRTTVSLSERVRLPRSA